MSEIEVLEDKAYLTWQDIERDTIELAKKLTWDKNTNLVCISRGGLVVGQIIGYYLGIKKIHSIALHSYQCDRSGTNPRIELLTPFLPMSSLTDNYIFLDDINDTSKTMKFVQEVCSIRNMNYKYATIYHKEKEGNESPHFYTKTFDANKWVVFPWDELKNK